jgi:hypothetical protein
VRSGVRLEQFDSNIVVQPQIATQVGVAVGGFSVFGNVGPLTSHSCSLRRMSARSTRPSHRFPHTPWLLPGCVRVLISIENSHEYGPVAGLAGILAGIEGGAVSDVINLGSSGVGALNRMIGSSASERAFHVSQPLFTLRHTRPTVSLPMAPASKALRARRTRYVLVPAR